MSADILDAGPWRIQECNGCWGREYGVIGHLLSVWLIRRPFSLTPDCGGHPPLALSMVARIYVTILMISRVTTPAPMGAIFRNEGRSFTPDLPWMEKGTQGVSPSFKEEVAWGSGWFPLPT